MILKDVLGMPWTEVDALGKALRNFRGSVVIVSHNEVLAVNTKATGRWSVGSGGDGFPLL